jgi:hypothetical protein
MAFLEGRKRAWRDVRRRRRAGDGDLGVDGEAPGQSGRRLVEVDGLEETCAHARVKTARTQRREGGGGVGGRDGS